MEAEREQHHTTMADPEFFGHTHARPAVEAASGNFATGAEGELSWLIAALDMFLSIAKARRLRPRVGIFI